MRENNPEMHALFATMRGIGTGILTAALDKAQQEKEEDPSAGIFVAKLDVPAIDIGGQSYAFYGARVLGKTAAGNQPFVTPHRHLFGDEPYLFREGTGEMNFGQMSESGDAVVWRKPVVVNVGDEFLIREGAVHSFRNLGDEPVDFFFSCPESHLQDHSETNPKGDRYIVKDLKNGVPPHFNG